MRRRFCSRSTRHWIISFLLLAVTARALIPAGFMPSPDRPFTLQICPDGFPAQLLRKPASGPVANDGVHHHDHAHHRADAASQSPQPEAPAHPHEFRAEHCVFAAVASVGPPAETQVIAATTDSFAAPQFLSTTPAAQSLRFRIQQPRAPPALS